MNAKFLTVLMVVFAGIGCLRSFAENNDPEVAGAIAHWQSLRFGMFIHWGPVSPNLR